MNKRIIMPYVADSSKILIDLFIRHYSESKTVISLIELSLVRNSKQKHFYKKSRERILLKALTGVCRTEKLAQRRVDSENLLCVEKSKNKKNLMI